MIITFKQHREREEWIVDLFCIVIAMVLEFDTKVQNSEGL